VAGWATLIPTADGRAAARDGRQRIVNVSEDRLMSTRARLVLVALTVVAATLVTRPAAAQLPDKFTNLTVLPKDVSKESTFATARSSPPADGCTMRNDRTTPRPC
jgi:hypothetical protein